MARRSFDSSEYSSGYEHSRKIMDNQTSAVITLREVYDAVVGLKVDLDGIPKIAADHENRIRDLERKVWSFSGLAAIVGAVLAQVISFLLK